MSDALTWRLVGTSVIASAYTVDLIKSGSQGRDARFTGGVRALQGYSAEFAYVEMFAERSTVETAGPLPYFGSKHTPVDVVHYLESGKKVEVDIHTVEPDGPFNYPYWHWYRQRWPHLIVVAEVRAEGRDADLNPLPSEHVYRRDCRCVWCQWESWSMDVFAEIEVRFLGAIDGNRLRLRRPLHTQPRDLYKSRSLVAETYTGAEGTLPLYPGKGRLGDYVSIPRDGFGEWVKLNLLQRLLRGLAR